MPEEGYDFMPAQHLMQPAEIAGIAGQFVALGVNKIRLTGGEPLARHDFADIVGRLQSLPVELTLTTNATLLHRFFDTLETAGVRQLNISLDTLSADRFLLLTRRNTFDTTLRNIETAITRGFDVKINMVVMKGINHDEVPQFIAWTKAVPIEVRFIEFMPFSGNHWEGEKVVTQQALLDLIATHYTFEQVAAGPHSTSTPYRVAGHRGRFAIISTMSNPFCSGCNRMRLTADGKMKNCLFSKEELNLLAAFREGQPLAGLIRKSVTDKAERLGGQFGDKPYEQLDGSTLINRSMISIGG